ncbi:hypothetical protein DFH06DRAFT_356558 [Mycena polygramma]|nr:hypothetical protein DFH06DRAFT_356558 [Mycena polygramma]
MQRCNPFDIQELVDQFIDHLKSSHQDLTSCALTARSWTDRAQSHLFHAPHVTNPSLWDTEASIMRFYDVLRTSPHLVCHVRHMEIDTSAATIGSVAKICDFPFTHLERVSVVARKAPFAIQGATALQQLFSLPTVSHVQVCTPLLHLDTFLTLWERRPGIRHLALRPLAVGHEPADVDVLSEYRGRAPLIQLHSLCLQLERDRADIYRSILHIFDVSHLTALSIRDDMSVPWEQFTAPRIEFLDLVVNHRGAVMDLSRFPNLARLRMGPGGYVDAIAKIISTVTSTHHIATVTLDMSQQSVWGTQCAQLDSALGAFRLPMRQPPVVEFEMRKTTSGVNEKVILFFRSSASRDMIRFIFRSKGSQSWWENVVDTL